jgi:hypothetical protein
MSTKIYILTAAICGCLFVSPWQTSCRAELALEIRDDVSGAFVDISGSGNSLSLSDDQEVTRFSIFLGRDIRIGNNGGVALASNGNLAWRNRNLPSNQAFGRGVEAFLPYWDDLDSESGDVYWEDLGDRLVVQWDDLNHYPGNTATSGITFQAQIFKSSADAAGGDVIAQFIYTDTKFVAAQSIWDDGASATVGYQNAMTSLVWSYNQAVITNGTVITLQAVVPEPSSLVMMMIAGTPLLFRRRRRMVLPAAQ